MSLKSNIIENDTVNDFVHIEIYGDVTENCDFTKAMPKNLPKKIMISCHNIKKINSTGVKKWFNYFDSLCKAGHSLIFKALSPLLVEQKNQISNFLADGELYSIMVPFQCKNETCKKEFYIEADLSSLTPIINFEDQTMKAQPECPHCHSNDTEFGDFVDEYFNFLNHKNLKKAA